MMNVYKIHRLLAFLFLLLVPIACNLLGPSIEQTWHVTKMELGENDKESDAIYYDAFLSFYDDGSASFFNKYDDKDNESTVAHPPVYRTGQWRRHGDQLIFTLTHTENSTKFNINSIDSKWLVLEITDGPKETIGTILKCQVSNVHKSKSFDLLAPTSNRWRMKPDHSETRAELNTRVLAHVDFLLSYFKMINDNEQDYFEPRVLQTPFQFYANGIGLRDDFEKDTPWTSSFYNDDNAEQGGKMLINALRSIDDYPGGGTNYTEGYRKALLLIKEYLEK
jgi:hypothetical protein